MDDFTESADFIGAQKRGRAATKMKLDGFAIFVQSRRELGNLAAKIGNVIIAFIVVGGDDRGAAAEPAERLAEWNVKINRKIARTEIIIFDLLRKLLPCHSFAELGRRRIAGVTRPGHVIFFYQIQIYTQRFSLEIFNRAIVWRLFSRLERDV
ncbi:MAG: hypothetical protein WDM80_10500 [Limisphaerales bacterium]